jgi:peptidoglycan/LPS O-acetylase OafA/YrhL
MAKKTERIAVLDGLRVLAVLIAVVSYSIHPFWTDITKPFLNIGGIEFGLLFLNGWVGLSLLFILCGFNVTHELLGMHGKRGFKKDELRGYFKRLLCRLAPSYYLVLALLCLGLFPLFPQVDPDGVWGGRFIYHLLFLQDYLPADISPAFWFRAIDMKFSLLAPFLLAALLTLPRLRWRGLALVLLMLLMAGGRYLDPQSFSPQSSYIAMLGGPFHLSLDGLLAGMGCALLMHYAKTRDFLLRGEVAQALFFGGCLLILWLMLGQGALDQTMISVDRALLPEMLALGFSAMMLGLLSGSHGQRVFAARPLGPISLTADSLYLIHMPLLYPAVLTARFLARAGGVVIDSDLCAWLFVLLFYLLFSGLAAALLYRFVEKPALDWVVKRQKS